MEPRRYLENFDRMLLLAVVIHVFYKDWGDYASIVPVVAAGLAGFCEWMRSRDRSARLQ